MSDVDNSQALVSIVLSTYNRSNVLFYAVESVLRQTLKDWELLVIGDACTDDTDRLMRSFVERDKRISYHHRTDNFGEQSGPNNEGVARSSGRYIAFLNHDDVWLEDHLEILVQAIRDRGCDMVFSLVDYLLPDNTSRIVGATPSGEYDPMLFIPASSWLLKREMAEDVGPWRPARQLYNIPSQDWCFRAWKLGKKMELVATLSVAAVPSSIRKNVYSSRECDVNEQYFVASRDVLAFRQRALTDAVVGHSEQWLKRYSVGVLFKWGIINMLRRLARFSGLHPEAAKNFIRHPGKGSFIARLHKIRGVS